VSKDFLSFKEIINTEPGLIGVKKLIKTSEVVLKFYEIFPDLKNVVVPIKLEKEAIYLHVENSIWRSELKFREKVFIEKINKFFKEDLVTKIKFI
jgi:Dna[CI] antecedent, DciA